MVFSPEGKAYPCCYHFGYSIGDINKESLDDIWNGPRLEKLREQFRTGQPRICKKRMQNLKCHRNFEDLSRGEPIKKPLRLDLRLAGQCNLQCIMCDVWQMPNDRFTEENFWINAREDFLPYIKELDLLGGEPLIQNETYRLLNLMQEINPSCKISIVTNGHLVIRGERAKTLENANLKMIQVSLDSLNPQTYAAIRRGGNLELALKSLQYFLALRQNTRFDLAASICVQKLNWHELPEFLHFCNERNIIPIVQQLDYDPSGCASLHKLPMQEKKLILQELKTKVPPPFLVHIQTLLSRLTSDIARTEPKWHT